ncbi:flagellar M-ring protein FliF [Azoarcus indigens]|uniref:Flagellar M-ring protein n=2 Tax=Azoarcus indigens TaxID=29545 RepID=A0A4R6DT99_9RHOO|nr:flagellar M-ring protein FliF [Azoarcus indigens]
MPLFPRSGLRGLEENAVIHKRGCTGNSTMATAENVAEGLPAADAPPASGPPSRFQQTLQNINGLSQRQKIAAAAAIALAIALVVGVLLWNREPAYAVLFSNLDDRDGGTIINTLQQQNVPYRMSGDGRAILVPQEQVHQIRLRLAAEGLPKGGLVGFELLEAQKLGVSQFHEQVNYQRALEGELARTIQSIATVSSARVHLAMPKQTAFLRDDQKPTASVMVNMRPGRFLDPNQVAGIVHLVSSSVPRMSADGVNIVNQDGELLTNKPDPLRQAGLDPTQLQYVKEIETGLIRRIETILTPMFGKDNFRAQVAADVDFNQVEQTAETYKPNPAPDQAIRSQQTTEEYKRDRTPQGVPGALTNQPPVPATAPITNPQVPPNQAGTTQQGDSSRSAVLNYELDRTIQHVKQSLGQIKRLSVAVVVNQRPGPGQEGQPQTIPLSDEEIARITNLVREAVGYNQNRGDTINVASSPFTAGDAEPSLPLWKDPDVLELAKEAWKYILILAVLAFVYFAILRPLMRTVIPPPPSPEGEGAAGGPGGEGGPGFGDEDEDAEVELSPEALAGQTYENRLERARELARQDPKLVAGLIKEWMGLNEEGRK